MSNLILLVLLTKYKSKQEIFLLRNIFFIYNIPGILRVVIINDAAETNRQELILAQRGTQMTLT